MVDVFFSTDRDADMLRLILPALVFTLLAAPVFGEYQLQIGPDTTVIDGPINPDGTINYLAYLNQKLSQGVTPENNFAVDVALTMGEDAWPNAAHREKVMKGLGIEIPVEGPFFVRSLDFLGINPEQEETDRRWKQVHGAITGPWTTEQYPQVKRWLDEQDKALDRIVKSVNQKDRYYFPWIVAEGQPQAIEMVLLPWLSQLRGIARGFSARAEWKIAAGDLDGAWFDVRAMHRMADMSMREPYEVSWLVGVSIHNMAATVVEDIAESDQLTSERAKRIIGEIQKFEHFTPYRGVIDTAVRLSALDMVMHYWKGRGDLFPDPGDGTGDVLVPSIIDERMQSDQYDPNATLRAVNDWADRWVKAGRLEDYHRRTAALSRLERVSKISADLALKVSGGDRDAARLMRREISASNKFSATTSRLFVNLAFLGRCAAYRAETVIKMRLALAPVALAIGGYHAEHGKFPPDLNALVPDYLDSLPTDFATGELPVYRVEDGAAIIYSLGTNLKDDGGVDDPADGDIVFRIER